MNDFFTWWKEQPVMHVPAVAAQLAWDHQQQRIDKLERWAEEMKGCLLKVRGDCFRHNMGDYHCRCEEIDRVIAKPK
jgi:hypothetical protein